MTDPRQGSTGRPARRIAISGASGLIGSALVRSLAADGFRVHPLVRREARPGSGEIAWNPQAGTVDAAALEGIDSLVHLAGENVGRRWTAERKRRIRESRVCGTRLLAETLGGLATTPRVLVSASAVGFYGDRGDELLTEGSSPGTDFLAGVTREWEAALAPAARAGIRTVPLRLGVVLSRDGGALKRLLLPFRFGLGGRIGSGRQWMSWIGLDDAVRAFRFALEHEELRGPANAVAPEPVSNSEFTRTLARVLGRPALFPVPAPALRLALGEMAEATILAGQRVLPEALRTAGFEWSHSTLEAALNATLGV